MHTASPVYEESEPQQLHYPAIQANGSEEKVWHLNLNKESPHAHGRFLRAISRAMPSTHIAASTPEIAAGNNSEIDQHNDAWQKMTDQRAIASPFQQSWRAGRSRFELHAASAAVNAQQ